MITAVPQYFINPPRTQHNMLIIGLLSTQDEVREIQFIAKVCTVNDRIRLLAHIQKCKQLNDDYTKQTK